MVLVEADGYWLLLLTKSKVTNAHEVQVDPSDRLAVVHSYGLGLLKKNAILYSGVCPCSRVLRCGRPLLGIGRELRRWDGAACNTPRSRKLKNARN